MAVPAARGPASSASSVYCTPFQPTPKKPKHTASGAISQGEVPGPITAMASAQSPEPSPAIRSTTRRRPPKSRSERRPKTTRPAMPVTWARTR